MGGTAWVAAIAIHLLLLVLSAIWVIEERFLTEDEIPKSSRSSGMIIVCEYPGRPKPPRALADLLRAREAPASPRPELPRLPEAPPR